MIILSESYTSEDQETPQVILTSQQDKIYQAIEPRLVSTFQKHIARTLAVLDLIDASAVAKSAIKKEYWDICDEVKIVVGRLIKELYKGGDDNDEVIKKSR